MSNFLLRKNLNIDFIKKKINKISELRDHNEKKHFFALGIEYFFIRNRLEFVRLHFI